MSTSEELKKKLEALKELKGQYYVGSQDAFHYLKAMNFYENLWQELRQAKVTYLPDIRELSHLCHELCYALDNWLEHLSVQLSTPESISVVADHYVDSPTLIVSDMPEACATNYYWSVDFKLFLKSFLSVAPEHSTDRRIFSRKFIFDFLEEGAVVNLPFLIFKKTGERISPAQFIKYDTFRQGNGKDFWMNVETQISYYRNFPESLQNLSSKIKRTWSLVKKSYCKKEFENCHNFFQVFEANKSKEDMDLQSDSEDDFLTKEFGTTREESDYLLDIGNLFERAEREYTLGTFTVERRIALNYVSYFYRPNSSVPAAELVDKAIKRALESRKRAKERDYMESYKRQTNYQYLALKKNRPWLIEFFSR